MIKLTDCGAIEGQPADDAFMRALDKVSLGKDNTILIDGIFKITRQNNYDFITKSSQLILQGNGSASRLIPDFDPGKVGFNFGNLESFTARDFVCTGTPGKTNDCGAIFLLAYTNQVVFDNVHFYGLSVLENDYGMIRLDNCGVVIKHCQIRGCAASPDVGLFNLERWRQASIRDCDFVDYGVLDGVYQSKTPLSAPNSWISFQQPNLPGDALGCGIPVIERVTFDEGAIHAVHCTSKTAAWVKGLHLKNVNINVSGHSGLLMNKIENLVIEDTYFTWAKQRCLALEGKDIKRTSLIRCTADQGAKDIKLTGRIDKLVMKECMGFQKVLVPATAKWITEH